VLRIAFVSAPGSSTFMTEILAAVADAVRAVAEPDVEVVTHHGLVADVVDAGTVAVVVPHEYFAVAPAEPELLHARTVGFGVEHPGTDEFEHSVEHAGRLGARFEISQDSLAELTRRGLDGTLFPLGHVPAWDQWHGRPRGRGFDVSCLPTDEPRRLRLLAHAARPLAGLRTELLIPPHEPMTERRPDFLVSADKWRLLARSKVLLNLHRGEKAALEWVRVLEAVHNGCVVVTEPSQELGPLVPDEHLVVAEPEQVGQAAAALVADEPRRARIAHSAYDLCRKQLGMGAAARSLVEVCRALSDAAPAPAQPLEVSGRDVINGWPDGKRPMAGLLPAIDGGRWLHPSPPTPMDRTRSTPARRGDHRIGLLCTVLSGDGAPQDTAASAHREGPGLAVHVGRGEHRGVARNALLAATDEPYLAVLDAGDELVGDAVLRMAELLRFDPGLDAVLCMATYGDTLVNVLVPEERRLERRAYITRGYLVRRTALQALGGFTEETEHGDLVDHQLWWSLAAGGARTTMLRRIGFALRPSS
jgi:hypothetical protein